MLTIGWGLAVDCMLANSQLISSAMLTTDFVEALGKDNVQVYGKAAIVGVNGEYEHGAIWHEAALAFKAGGITEGRRVRQ